MEFTAQAAEQIAAYRESHRTLRAALLTASRHRNRHNGRVIVSLKPGDVDQLHLPPEPDIVAALGILWNLPTQKGAKTDTVKKLPTVRKRKPSTKPETK